MQMDHEEETVTVRTYLWNGSQQKNKKRDDGSEVMEGEGMKTVSGVDRSHRRCIQCYTDCLRQRNVDRMVTNATDTYTGFQPMDKKKRRRNISYTIKRLITFIILTT